MKKLKSLPVLQIIALVCFVLTLIALGQKQNVFSYTFTKTGNAIADATLDGAGKQVLAGAEALAPKNGYKMAFNNGASNEWGIIVVSTIISFVIALASVVASFLKCDKVKKVTNILLIVIGTLALASVAIYISSLGNTLATSKTLTNTLKTLTTNTSFKFSIGGSWAYFMGLVSQVIAAGCLLTIGFVKVTDCDCK